MRFADPDPAIRPADRIRVSEPATLIAIICDRLFAGETIAARLSEVSEAASAPPCLIAAFESATSSD
jgi:hypothetical protein